MPLFEPHHRNLSGVTACDNPHQLIGHCLLDIPVMHQGRKSIALRRPAALQQKLDRRLPAHLGPQTVVVIKRMSDCKLNLLSPAGKSGSGSPLPATSAPPSMMCSMR